MQNGSVGLTLCHDWLHVYLACLARPAYCVYGYRSLSLTMAMFHFFDLLFVSFSNTRSPVTEIVGLKPLLPPWCGSSFFYYLLLLFSKVDIYRPNGLSDRHQISQVGFSTTYLRWTSPSFQLLPVTYFRHFGRNRKLRNNFFIHDPISNFLFEIDSWCSARKLCRLLSR